MIDENVGRVAWENLKHLRNIYSRLQKIKGTNNISDWALSVAKSKILEAEAFLHLACENEKGL